MKSRINSLIWVFLLIIGFLLIACEEDPCFLCPDSDCSEVLLNENFEDQMDTRINYYSIGVDNVTAGQTNTDKFGSNVAFRFGTSTCPSNCFIPNFNLYDQNHSTILRITLSKSECISRIRFKTSELGYDWGSVGQIYLDSTLVEMENNEFGHYINSCWKKDESVRIIDLTIKKKARIIDIGVWDIAHGSEIMIDDLEIYYCPQTN